MSNINYNFNKLTPFRFFCLTNFPFIEEDFDSLTYYELLCKVVGYLNKVIDTTNAIGTQTEELTNAFNELKSYVDNYFTNLDVQTEINNKLDEMAEDGTLEKIINQEIFGDLNLKIEKNTKDISEINNKITNFPNFYIGAFFHGGFGAVSKTDCHFYSSLDGINFSEFNNNSNINNISSSWTKDFSLQFDKNRKRFLLASTGYTEDFDCLIFSSNDFVNWTEHKINLGYMLPHNNFHRWAPDLFIDDDGTIYLCISLERKRESDKVYYMEQVLYKCTDPLNLTFDKIGKIRLNDTSDNSNYIDGSFAKYNNNYYFLVKHVNNSLLELYSVSNIENINGYGLLNSQLQMEGLELEGGCLCFTDTTCNIYAENFTKWHGYSLLQTQLSNFPSFTKNARWLESLTNKTSTTSPEQFDARHGNVIYITDPEAKKIILNNTNISFTKNNAIDVDNYPLDFNFYFGQNPTNVIAYPFTKYSLENSWNTVTIDNLINPYNLPKLTFLQPNHPLTLNINKINGIEKNLTYTNNGSNKTGITVLDLNSGRFEQPFYQLKLDGITNNISSVANISLLSATNYNGFVYMDFIIKVLQTTTLNNVHIATLPDKFRPRFYNLPQHYVIPNQEIYIDGAGQIHADLRNCSVNQQIRCTAIFIPNN